MASLPAARPRVAGGQRSVSASRRDTSQRQPASPSCPSVPLRSLEEFLRQAQFELDLCTAQTEASMVASPAPVAATLAGSCQSATSLASSQAAVFPMSASVESVQEVSDESDAADTPVGAPVPLVALAEGSGEDEASSSCTGSGRGQDGEQEDDEEREASEQELEDEVAAQVPDSSGLSRGGLEAPTRKVSETSDPEGDDAAVGVVSCSFEEKLHVAAANTFGDPISDESSVGSDKEKELSEVGRRLPQPLPYRMRLTRAISNESWLLVDRDSPPSSP